MSLETKQQEIIDEFAIFDDWMEKYEYIIDLFNRFDSSEPFSLDPSGLNALREAKRVRRAALRAGEEAIIADKARASFGMPATKLTYASRLGEPVYPAPARDMSS